MGAAAMAAGCTTNDEEYLAEFYNAAKLAGERYWQLPLFEEYEEMLMGRSMSKHDD